MSDGRVATWPALGTTASVIVSDPAGLRVARHAVEAELAALDLACSRFRDDSELSRLNASRGRGICASPRLLESVTVALRAAALTDGTVEPTIGETLVLAGYDRGFAELGKRPVRLVGRRVPGWKRIVVDRIRSEVRVPCAVRLDLGATSKALGADRAAAAASRAARRVGVLVNLGR